MMRKHNKLWTFLLALLASVVLWIYVVTVVAPDDTVTIRGIPVTIDGTETLEGRNLMITAGENTTVNMKLAGKRTDLKELNSSNIILTADAARIKEPGEYNLSYSISYPATVASGDISATPSRTTVRVVVSELATKELEIAKQTTGEVLEGYTLGSANITLDAETVSITGPAELLDEYASAYVVLNVGGLDTTTKQTATIHFLDSDGNEITLTSHMEASLTSVEATIPVLRMAELTFGVNIVAGGGATEADIKVECWPRTITVSGEARTIDALNGEWKLGTVKLEEMLETSVAKEFTVELPQNITNESDVQTVRVTITITGLTTKTLTLPSERIRVENQPADADLLTFASASITVKLRGKPEDLAKISEESLWATIDYEDCVNTSTTVAVTVTVPDYPSVGVLGTPTIVVTRVAQES